MLVVDANPLAQGMLKAMLEPAARSVSAVGDVDDAIEAALGAPADIIFADGLLLAPSEGAPSALAALKAAYPSARIVAALPAAAAAQAPGLLAAGADGVVIKPISGADLLVRLGQVMAPAGAPPAIAVAA